MPDSIKILGARENNLKNISVEFRKGCITAVFGPSGSGKSSLLIDTLAAEAKIRLALIANLRAGKSKNLENSHPKVDSISGLGPLICLEKGRFQRGKETVASFLGLNEQLYQAAIKIGKRTCPICHAELRSLTPAEMLRLVEKEKNGELISVNAILFRGTTKREISLNDISTRGFSRVYIDEKSYQIDHDSPTIPKLSKSLEVVIDRLRVSPDNTTLLEEAIKQALKFERVGICVRNIADNKRLLLSPRGACISCEHEGIGIKPIHFRCKTEKSEIELAQLVEIQEIRIANFTLAKILEMEISQCLELDDTSQFFKPLNNFISAAKLLVELGLGHLTLLRALDTLSTGERHRLRLAKQLIRRATGLTYIIDEPSYGLHAKDQQGVISRIVALRSAGNTVILNDHEHAFLAAADYGIEIGLGAGSKGGSVVWSGRMSDFSLNPPASNPKIKLSSSSYIQLENIRFNNLKIEKLQIPVGALSAVCGVSGSGKSSLLFGVIYPALKATLSNTPLPASVSHFILPSDIKQIVATPLQENSPSLGFLSSYLQLFEPLRNIFAKIPSSIVRNYKASHFSLSAKDSLRCSNCKGAGIISNTRCSVCSGRRFSQEALDIRFKGYSIADILDLTVEEATVFSFIPNWGETLKLLIDLKLEYLKLGQALSDLSLGELQRVRMGRSLIATRRNTVYLFDQPTSGMAAQEVGALLKVFHGLIENGNTIIAIEHNQHFIEGANYTVELGPGAGRFGGKLIKAEES